MGSFEESTINLPQLENGVEALGDLWDCRKSEFVGSLFSKTPGGEHLEAHQKKEEDYTLMYMKNSKDRLNSLKVDASISFEVGSIILLKGAAHYDEVKKKKFHQEELRCKYSLETYSVRLQMSARSEIDELVRKQLVSGEKTATHVVTKIVYGAEAEATILLESNENIDNKNIGGSFEGKLIAGPVTVSAKASVDWLDNDENTNYKKNIQVRAKPPLKGGPPSKIEDMFKSIEALADHIESEKPYPKDMPQVTGVPLRYVLVPLNSLIDYKLEQLYLKLEESIMTQYTDMLLLLMDFQGEGYIREKILTEDRRLTTMLKDQNMPITVEIINDEIYYDKLSREFKQTAFDTLVEYKKGAKKASHMLAVVNAFNDKFNILEFGQKVQKYTQRCKAENTGVQIGDIEAEQKLNFFTNKINLEDWWLPEKKAKILLETSTSSDTIPGTFLTLYGMAKKLNELDIEIGVAFPAISSGFKLTLKILGRSQTFENMDIIHALKMLGIASDQGGSTIKRFYQIVGLQNSIKLPLEDNLDDIISLIFTMKYLDGIQMCESYLKFKEEISAEDNRWKFVISVEALDSAAESVLNFNNLRKYFKNHLSQFECDWIVGYFNIQTYHDAPLFLLFRNNLLVYSCFDHLDILILKKIFQEGIINDQEMLKKFHPRFSKRNFHNQKMKYLLQVLENIGEDIRYFGDKEMASFKNGENRGADAIIVTRDSISGNQLEIISSIGRICLKFFPSLLYVLKEHGWSDSKQGFSIDITETKTWDKLNTQVKNFLEKENEFMTKVSYVLKAMSSEGFSLDDISKQLANIEGHQNYIKILKNKIDSFKDATPELRREGILSVLQGYIDDTINQAPIVDGEESGPDYFHLRTFQTLVQDLASIGKNSFAPKIYDTVSEYVNRVKFDSSQYPGLMSDISNSLTKQDLYQSLSKLSNLGYDPKIFKILQEISKFNDIDNPQDLQKLIEKMSLEVFTPANYSDIWQNYSFAYTISRNSDNRGLLEMIKLYQCHDGTIPHYIPREISDKIKPLLIEYSPEDYDDWVKNWHTNDDAIQAFQKIINRNVIPKNFPPVLRSNLAFNENLRKSLSLQNVLFYWVEGDNYFTEPWGIATISKAMNSLMIIPNDENSNPHSITLNLKDLSNYEKVDGVTEKIEQTPEWQKYSIEFSQNFAIEKILVNKILESPLLEEDEISDAFSKIFPYIIQKILMGNVNVIEPSQLASYIRYKDESQGPTPGQIDFSDDEEESDGIIPLFSRLEVFSLLFSTCDLLLCHKIMDTLCSKSSLAIPLVLKHINPEIQFTSIMPILKEINVQDFKLFTGDFRLIMCLKVGDGAIGKSQILNKLFKNPETYYSCNETGNRNVRPISHQGFTEFTWLNKENTSEIFWDKISKSKEKNRIRCPIYLANIHGDSRDPETQIIIKHLEKYTTSFVIFWNLQDWEEFTVQRKEFGNIIDNKTAFHLFVDPAEDIKGKIGSSFVTTENLDDEENLERVQNVLISSFLKNNKKILDHGPNEAILEKDFYMGNMISEEFLTIIRNEGTRNIKAALRLQKAQFGNIHEFNTIWEHNELLKNIMSYFVSILKLPSNIRSRNLAHLNYELQFLSKYSSSEYKSKLEKRRTELHQLLQNSPQGFEKSDIFYQLQNEIKQAKAQVIASDLCVNDFFNELTSFSQFYESVLDTYLQSFANYIAEGSPVTILQDPFTQIRREILQSVFETLASENIFVISIVGADSSGKSTFLDHLFGNIYKFSGQPEGTQGVILKYLKLDEELQSELKIDGIVLIDTEGLGMPEYQNDAKLEKWQRDMLTLILGISNLTILNITGDVIPREVCEIIEIALVNIHRTKDSFCTPDILLVRHESSEENNPEEIDTEITKQFRNIVEKVSSFCTGNEHQVGLLSRSSDTLDKIRLRIKNEEFLQRICHFGQVGKSVTLGYHEDAVKVFNFILKIIHEAECENYPARLYDWGRTVEDYWTIISSSKFASNYQNIECISEYFSFKAELDALKDLIDISLQGHRKFLLKEFEENMKMEVENQVLQKSMEDFMKKVLSTITNGVDNCESEENGTTRSACPNCDSASNSKQSLIYSKRGTKFEFEIMNLINLYQTSVVKSIQNEFEQMYFSSFFNQRAEQYILNILPKIFVQNVVNMDGVILPMVKQYFSENIIVIPAGRLIDQEIQIEYQNQQHVLTNMEQDIPDLEALVAFPDQGDGKVKLEWQENDWLQAKFEDLPKEMLSFHETEIFLVGMVRELKSKINAIIQQFCNENEKTMLSEFKQNVHIYAIKLFIKCMNEKQEVWNEKYNPLIKLSEIPLEEFLTDILKKNSESIPTRAKELFHLDVNEIPDRSLISINNIERDISLDVLYNKSNEFSIIGYKSLYEKTQKWRLLHVDGDKFRIESTANPNYVLTLNGQNNQVYLEKNTKLSSQTWVISRERKYFYCIYNDSGEKLLCTKNSSESKSKTTSFYDIDIFTIPADLERHPFNFDQIWFIEILKE